MRPDYEEIFLHTALPKGYQDAKVFVHKWLKADGQYVEKNEDLYVLRIGEFTEKNCRPSEAIKSIESGILKIVKNENDLILSHEVVFCINFDEEKIKELKKIKETQRIDTLKNTPRIESDDFTNSKIITWYNIGGEISEVIKTTSFKENVDLYFTINHTNNNNYIIFITKQKELVLMESDIISFLFEDDIILKFKIEKNSFKSSKKIHLLNNETYFETSLIITNNELAEFQNKKFLKWKIEISKNNINIIGGDLYIGGHYTGKEVIGSCNYNTKELQQILINKFSKEFQETVEIENPNFKGIVYRENANESVKEEECYVYLMVDLTNNYYKIGISNSPKYREFTLQSEKPTIELIASKKFINRKIAKSFEFALHTAYKEKRIRGEWFELNNSEINEIKYTLNN